MATMLTADRCDVECLHPEHVRPLLGRMLDTGGAGRVSGLFAVLADPTRVRILHALSLADELCVCDLGLLLGLTQSNTSHQLRLLRLQAVVVTRKVGRIVYYRLGDTHVRHLLADGLRHSTERGADLLEARSA